MIYQLRMDEVFEHNRAAFHARFRGQAARLMQIHGFHIPGMWEARTERRIEFLYLLAWPDEGKMRDAWARFMVDEEWRQIELMTSAQHGDLVAEIEVRAPVLTEYAPAISDWTRQAFTCQRSTEE